MKNLTLFLIIFFYSSISQAVEFQGKFEQGSFIIGKVQKGSKVQIDNRKIRITKDGYFAFGIGRDRKNNILIKITNNGKTEIIEKKVLKKEYNNHRVKGWLSATKTIIVVGNIPQICNSKNGNR